MFLQTITASIMTDRNSSVSEIMGHQFNMEMIVPQKPKEELKTLYGLTISLPVAILETKYDMNNRGSMCIMVELNRTIIHQRQTTGQN